MVGLERGTVRVQAYDPGWAELGSGHCGIIKQALGELAVDVAHVGSTSVPGLCAKPIIDVAVGVHSFGDHITAAMESAGYRHRPANDSDSQMFFAVVDGEWISAHIHVVRHMSMEWRNYINFKAYLTAFPQVRDAYAALKTGLAQQYPSDREVYTAAKADFITHTLRKAMVWSYLGKDIEAKVDRPIGYLHQKGEKSLLYPVNYGFIPGVLGGDGEELDVYFLGTDQPLKSFSGRVIAIVHRADDVEDKLVAAPADACFTAQEICRQIYFQEQYYDTTIKMLDGQKLHISQGREA